MGAELGTLLSAVVILATAAAAYVKSRANGSKLDVIGLSVDGNLTAARLEIAKLTAALTAAGVAVPPPAAVHQAALTDAEIARIRQALNSP